jgi:ubiquinone biosynthesis protein COQ4
MIEAIEAALSGMAGEEITSGNAISYLNGRRKVQTMSSVLVSSSRWLNDPAIREWISTESLRRNGGDYPLLYGSHELVTAIDRVRDLDRVDRLIKEERRKNKVLDRWFEERFISTYTLDDLGDNPPGSIGRLLYDHMKELGLSPELNSRRMADPDWAPEHDIDYFNLRSGQTHDFDHLLGEVGFDVMAEIFPTGLRTGNIFAHVGAELAGELLLINTLMIFPWMMRTMLHYPQAWPTLWRNLAHGYEVGQQSDLLFTARFEDIMHLTPAQARAALGVRGFGGPSSSEAASLDFGEGKLII